MPHLVYNAMVLREPYSGVEVGVYQTLRALMEYGSMPMTAYVPEGECRSLPECRHVVVKQVSGFGGSRLGRIGWEQGVLPRLIKRTGARLLYAPAYVAPRFAPCPYILTVHDLHVFSHPQFCTRSNRLHYGLILPTAIRRAARLVVYSPYVQEQIVQRYPEVEGRIVVIPPGIDPLLLERVDAEEARRVTEKLELPRDYLLFVGDVTPRKNIEGIVAVFAKLRGKFPGVNLVLAGAASRETRRSIRGMLAGAGLSGGVYLAGYIEPRYLRYVYAAARLLLFPSHDEGFGLPAIEAMACGCPAVCATDALRRMHGDAVVSCQEGGIDSIVQACTGLLADEEYRRAQIARGRERAKAFSWRSATARIEALCQEVLAEEGADV